MKLLIVDDNAPMRALLRHLCAGLATEIRDCADGAEAIAAFDEFQPDWTLMDLAMPGVDGLTAIRRIKIAHPGARILVITHHRSPEYEQAAQSAGACGYVTKDNLLPLRQLIAGAVQVHEQNTNSNSSNQKESLL